MADAAGVSVEYYSRLERGNLKGASEAVLNAVARALLLDDAEVEHLHNLARAQNGGAATRGRRASRSTGLRPGLQWVLDRITDAPAFIGNGRQDLVAANLLGRALYTDILAWGGEEPNFARFHFLAPAARQLYPEWDKLADLTVANLRTEAGRDPLNKDLHDLVGELCTRSEEFRLRWGAHDVRHHGSAVKRMRHSIAGELELAFEGFDLISEPGLSLGLYAAEPGSATDERLRLLASWAATATEVHRASPT